MVGDRDNPNREFVCQSDPRTDCVMPASRPGVQVFTDIHFYFHSATMDTTYTGTIQIGFFEGQKPHELKPKVIVKGGERATNASVSGIVSSKPGSYPMTIAVMAASGTSQEIRDRVPVTLQ
jgi:hypothetical protein